MESRNQNCEEEIKYIERKFSLYNKIEKQNICQILIITDCERQKRHVLSLLDILKEKLTRRNVLFIVKVSKKYFSNWNFKHFFCYLIA